MARDEEVTEAASAAHDARQDAERIKTRANLLPEEQSSGGSADPEAQAKIILEDSQRRTEEPEAAPTTFVEHRSSDETV